MLLPERINGRIKNQTTIVFYPWKELIWEKEIADLISHVNDSLVNSIRTQLGSKLVFHNNSF